MTKMLKMRHFYHLLENIISFRLLWQQHISEKLEQGEQRAGKVTAANQKQMEEYLMTT